MPVPAPKTGFLLLKSPTLSAMMLKLGRRMRNADLTTRAVAAFVDFLIVTGLTRLPDVTGALSAAGYLLVRDGLFARQSVGKKLVGLRVAASDGAAAGYRESILRNAPLALIYVLFLVPYAGWLLGPFFLAVESLVALGDERGMRIGDMLAGTVVVREEAKAPEEGAANGTTGQPATPSPPGGGPIDPGI